MFEKIQRLKKERHVAVIAHHYAPVEAHEFADVLADSRGFFEGAKRIATDNIHTVLVIAPLFFAEITAAILSNKKVVVPIISECPVAGHRNLHFDNLLKFIREHPGIPFVCYATSPLEAKLLADYVTIPGEVVRTVQSVDAPKVLYAGEKNSADEAIRKCGDKIINYPYNPVCNVYNSATLADLQQAKKRHSNACVMVHPECKPEIVEASDFSIGTGEMYQYIKAHDERDTYILGVERGFYERVKKEFPEKTFVHLSPTLMCNVFSVFRRDVISDYFESPDKAHEVRLNGAFAKKLKELFDELFARNDTPLRNPGHVGQ